MSVPTLRAERRTILGSKVRQLRRGGQVPGVVYGPVVAEPIAVSVDRREFQSSYQRAGHSTVLTVEWPGGRQAVLIREVQINPANGDPVHVRFYAPHLDQPVQARVSVVLHHQNARSGGVLTQLLEEIELEGLPESIPHQVFVDISDLGVGDIVRVADLILPMSVTAVTGGDEVVAQISAERGATPEEAAEAEATAAATEAETADVVAEPSAANERG